MCSAPKQGLTLPASVDIEKETVITGRVVDGSGQTVGGAFVRLLDSSDEFTAEVVASATGDFRFFAAPGTWTLRALSPAGNGDASVAPSRRGHPRGRRQGRLRRQSPSGAQCAGRSTAALDSMTWCSSTRSCWSRHRRHHLVRAVCGVPADHRRVVTAARPRDPDQATGSGLRRGGAERAKITAARNIPAFDDLPIPADTANLREGVSLNDALLALLPLVGVWRGEGKGRGPHGDYRVRPADHRLPRRRRVPELGSPVLAARRATANTTRPACARPDSGASSTTPTTRARPRRSNCCSRIPPATSSCSTAIRSTSRRGSWRPMRWRAASPACSSAAPSGSTASSRAATSPTSRSASTPTAGWCRICRRGCRGTSADPSLRGAGPDMERPPSRWFLVGRTEGLGGRVTAGNSPAHAVILTRCC